MDTMTLNFVINDDISAFLSNTYKPPVGARTYTLSELRGTSLDEPHDCAKSRYESLAPIIEGIIDNLGKQHSTRNIANQGDIEKKKSLPEDAQELQSSELLTPPCCKRTYAEQGKSINFNNVMSAQDDISVKGSLFSSAAESSQALNNVLPTSSLVCDGKPRNKTIHGYNNAEQSFSSSKLGKNIRKPLKSFDNTESSLSTSCAVVGKANRECGSLKNSSTKYLPKPEKQSTSQSKSCILHTSAVSSQPPKEDLLPSHVMLHDILCINREGVEHGLLKSKKLSKLDSKRKCATDENLSNPEKWLKIDSKSRSATDKNVITHKKQLTIDSKSTRVTDKSAKNFHSKNCPLTSLYAGVESCRENTVLSVEVLNTSRYGRPLRKRFGLGSEECEKAEKISACQTKKLSRNKVINSTGISKSTVLKSNQFSDNSQSLSSETKFLKNQFLSASHNFKQKYSDILAICQINDGLNSTKNNRILRSSTCKQLSEPSNLITDKNKIASVSIQTRADQKPKESKKRAEPLHNAGSHEQNKVELNKPIVKKQSPKKSGKRKPNDIEIKSLTESKDGSAEDIKMSRYGRQLKKVALDHYATPAVVREIRSRAPAKCSKTLLFPIPECSDQLQGNISSTSSKSRKKPSVKNNKKSIKEQTAPSFDLLSKRKKNLSNQKESGKKVAQAFKRNLTPETQDAPTDNCSQKRNPHQKQPSRKNDQPLNPEPEKVTAQKGTLKRLQQRHKRQQFLLLQQQQEDDAAELLADNPHLLPSNQFRMHDLLQSVSSPSSSRAGGSSTPCRIVDSSSLLPMLSPVSPSGSVSLGGLSFSTPRAHGDWHWFKNSSATSRNNSPQYGGNCNLLLTPVVPDTNDVHRIIFNKGKGCKKKKKNLSSLVEEQATTDVGLLQDPVVAGAPLGGRASKTSKLERKDKRFKWLELPNNPTPDYTDNGDEESVDQYFEDSF